MTDTLHARYQAYCHRFRDLFPRCPLPSFEDWLDDEADTRSRLRAESYVQALGAEAACVEWAEGYLAARRER